MGRSTPCGPGLNNPPYLQPLHVGDLVLDPVLQGGQDPQLSVDPDLHVRDPLTQILGQVVEAAVLTWWKTCGHKFAFTLRPLTFLSLLFITSNIDVFRSTSCSQTLTCISGEFFLQVVVRLLGRLVGRAVLGLVLVQEAANLLDLLQQHGVVFIHQTLNPAARRTLGALKEDGTDGQTVRRTEDNAGSCVDRKRDRVPSHRWCRTATPAAWHISPIWFHAPPDELLWGPD